MGCKKLAYGVDSHNFRVVQGTFASLEKVVGIASDYYPFGMTLEERTWSTAQYRFGFNGKDFFSDWNRQDYGFRIYDPRKCRFESVDPLAGKYPMLTTYQFASNRPIDGSDLDGKEWSQESVVMKDGTKITHNHVHYKVFSRVSDVDIPALMADIEEIYVDNLTIINKHEIIIQTFSYQLVSQEPKNKQNADKTVDTDGLYFVFYNDVVGIHPITQQKDPNLKKHINGATLDFESNSSSQKNIVYIAVSRTDKNGVSSNRENPDLVRTSLHEGLHTILLQHPWLEKPEIDIYQSDKPTIEQSNKIKNNIMNSGGNRNKELQSTEGTNVTPGQRKKANKTINEQTKKK